MSKSPQYEENELKAAFAREALRLAPYHRKQRIAAATSIGVVMSIWLVYIFVFFVVLDAIPIKLTVAVVLGTVVLGALIHKKLAPRNPFTGE